MSTYVTQPVRFMSHKIGCSTDLKVPVGLFNLRHIYIHSMRTSVRICGLIINIHEQIRHWSHLMQQSMQVRIIIRPLWKVSHMAWAALP